jgi:hypothetical protein
MIRRLWLRGPSAVPEVDYDLPSSTSFLTPETTPDPTDEYYLKPRYSLNNGLDVMKRYKAKYPDTPQIRFLTMIGTYDICHVGCKPMQERLIKLGEDVVKADYIEVSVSFLGFGTELIEKGGRVAPCLSDFGYA